MGFCQCGCGQKIKPERRFISGHNFPMRIREYADKQAKSVSQTWDRKRGSPCDRKAYFAQWHREHRDRRLLSAIIRKRNIKTLVLTYYGGGNCACVRCGFDILAALTIDHIDNDGFKSKNGHGHTFYAKLIKADYPGGFQTLCFNCQYIKREEYERNKVK